MGTPTTMQGSRTTVVVLTHERRSEVLRTLGCLQALPEDPPIVVVDNASSDGTAEAVRQAFPLVQLIRLPHNAGAAGRNAGVLAATTPYVALCDDDTWWTPGAIRRAESLLNDSPQCAVVCARVLVGPEQRLDPTCVRMDASPLPSIPNDPGRPILGFLAGASVVRRDAILDAGGFAPRYFIGGEEELLSLDLAAAGWRLCYCPELVVHHHPCSGRDVQARRWLALRNRLWTTWLRYPVAPLLRRTAQVVTEAGNAGLLRSVTTHALVGVPWVLRHRRRLPAPVRESLRRLANSQEP